MRTGPRVPAFAFLATLACAVFAFAPAARAQGSGDTWSVWMGPQAFLSAPLGDFKTANPRLAMGGGFTLAFIHTDSHLGARFDMGLAQHGRQSSEILTESVFGDTAAAILETSTRLSWGMIGLQWDQNPRGAGAYAFGTVGVEGANPKSDVFRSGGASDPPDRPESNRGFTWAAGLGARVRPTKTSVPLIVAELEYRRRGAANYVASPAFDQSSGLSRYRTAHGDISTVLLRVGIALTKYQ